MLFGTDGIRGVAGEPPLDHNTVFAVGAALGRFLTRRHADSRIVIGQDTRESSAGIADSITLGLAWARARVRGAGVMTTPAIAYLARGGFAAGVVVSASHNPWTDNGIKIFGHDGFKLADELEEQLEADIFDLLRGRGTGMTQIPPPNTAVSSTATDPALLSQYVTWLTANASAVGSLKVLVDCGNGAATPVAHEVFRACGVEADFIHHQPDGRNINEHCGALYPEAMAGAVLARPGRYHLGITLDGDADRCLLCDAGGKVVNGDGVLLAAARDMKMRGRLRGDTVVATTMSNMGLEIALRSSGIRMLRAPVGDKYVLEEMQNSGATLGGEQSGHVLFRDGDATAGDGLLTALRVMEIMARSRQPLAELVADLKEFPQNIKNVRVREKKPFADVPEVASAIREAERELDGNGRVVVRYSGTEALARVMVEAQSSEKMRRITASIAGAIQKTIGID